MSPLWESLDKIGIVIGILMAIVEMGQMVWLYFISRDVEDIQEDVEDINER